MIPRRDFLATGMVAIGSCARQDSYFGKLTPPPNQTLTYEIEAEPSSLDPATCLASSEAYIMPALLETLLSPDPFTLQPSAALATHYELDSTLTEYTFFL